MSEENDFDRIPRLWASPMPRRQAIRMIAGVTLGILNSAPLLAQTATSKSNKLGPGTKITVLQLPVHNFVMHGVALYDVINALRQSYSAPVSYITSDSTSKLNVNVSEGTVQDVLDQMAAQDASYVWKSIKGKVFFLPKLAKYQASVKGVSIVGVPRWKAALEFADYLGAHIDGFKDFGGALIGAILPELKTPVTLTKDATVIECLFQLIGDDPSVVLSVTPSSSGESCLFLSVVQSKQK